MELYGIYAHAGVLNSGSILEVSKTFYIFKGGIENE